MVPGLQRDPLSVIEAVASRDLDSARKFANRFGIPRYYGSYEALLKDPKIDAVYIPLPNHLHVQWSRRALEAGKHVLCEKPLALTTAEVRSLIELRDRTGLKIGEAFMVHTHPQWVRARNLIKSPKFGQLRAVQGFFSYNNRDSENVRNKYPLEEGGGGLWDIGCYLVYTGRVMFEEEPEEVIALLDRDPEFRTDRLTSAIMKFPSGHAVFTCGTQIVPWQRVVLCGEKQRLEITVPFNQPAEVPSILLKSDGIETVEPPEEILIPPVNQYSVQANEFARAILNDTEVPVPLESSFFNTAAIRALIKSAETGHWEKPELLSK
jgi:predicted dehydrogenase